MACEPADCGGRLDRFGLEGNDPIRIASGRGPLTGWISIGVEVRFFGTRSSNQFHSRKRVGLKYQPLVRGVDIWLRRLCTVGTMINLLCALQREQS